MESKANQSGSKSGKEQNQGQSNHENYLAISLRSMRIFLTKTLQIQGNAKPQETIESIKNDIDFQGYNVWILIFSILIASIGLNVNSGAVVIGAMLISPLMGPILGVGLSLGINDWATMKRSLRNFAIMFTVSIITSTLYFVLTPLEDAQSELLARVRPTLLDVFVAFIGGLAGILAANRKIKSNVVPGVAIATALMPPLCTAGYGIANGEWSFFLGAFYLFLINSIFISLATFVIVRFLKFPIKDFVDPARAKRARRYLVMVLFIIMIPSAYTFYNVVTESYFNRRVDSFIAENVYFEGAELVKKEIRRAEGKEVEINLVFFGEPIPNSVIDSWRSKLGLYSLEGARIKVVQPQNLEQMNSDEVNKLVDVFSKSQLELQDKNVAIANLQNALSKERSLHLPLEQLSRELKVMHPRLYSLSMARMVEYHRGEMDTLMIAKLKWATPDTQGLHAESAKISDWLRVRLQLDTLAFETKLFKPSEEKMPTKGFN